MTIKRILKIETDGVEAPPAVFINDLVIDEPNDDGEVEIDLEVGYVYETCTRGSVVATADHERGQVRFRLLNTQGFEVVQTTRPVAEITHDTMDELARRIVGEPSVFA